MQLLLQHAQNIASHWPTQQVHAEQTQDNAMLTVKPVSQVEMYIVLEVIMLTHAVVRLKYMRNMKKQNGFTLVEFLIYITVASILVSLVMLFLNTLVTSRVKNETVNEVEQQGLQVMHLMSQVIRNGEAINAPLPAVIASSVSIDVVEASEDPTVFDELAGILRVTRGADSAIDLTNDYVTVTGLTFENVIQGNDDGAVRLEFTLSRNNPTGRNEYEYSRTFYSTVSLRY